MGQHGPCRSSPSSDASMCCCKARASGADSCCCWPSRSSEAPAAADVRLSGSGERPDRRAAPALLLHAAARPMSGVGVRRNGLAWAWASSRLVTLQAASSASNRGFERVAVDSRSCSSCSCSARGAGVRRPGGVLPPLGCAAISSKGRDTPGCGDACACAMPPFSVCAVCRAKPCTSPSSCEAIFGPQRTDADAGLAQASWSARMRRKPMSSTSSSLPAVAVVLLPRRSRPAGVHLLAQSRSATSLSVRFGRTPLRPAACIGLTGGGTIPSLVSGRGLPRLPSMFGGATARAGHRATRLRLGQDGDRLGQYQLHLEWTGPTRRRRLREWHAGLASPSAPAFAVRSRPGRPQPQRPQQWRSPRRRHRCSRCFRPSEGAQTAAAATARGSA
eukprot:365985-Chlamydomonas_euryale.AAC.10